MMSRLSSPRNTLPVLTLFLAGSVATLLCAQTPSTRAFGRTIDAREQIRESRTLDQCELSQSNMRILAAGARFCGNKPGLAWPMRGRPENSWVGRQLQPYAPLEYEDCIAPVSAHPKTPAGCTLG